MARCETYVIRNSGHEWTKKSQAIPAKAAAKLCRRSSTPQFPTKTWRWLMEVETGVTPQCAIAGEVPQIDEHAGAFDWAGKQPQELRCLQITLK
jgi:hypothetical protein